MSNLEGFSVANLNPLKGDDPLGSADYNYFYRRDASARGGGMVTAADLVGPDGRCAFEPAPALGPAPGPGPAVEEPVAAGPSADPINPRSSQALYFTAGPQAGPTGGQQLPAQVRSGPSGIALSMTECQVVSVAGYTNQVQVSANERGERVTVLTYMSGERPGIYHFRNGRLVNMERVAVVEQPKKPQKPVKQKQAKAKPRQQ